ncbi:MAG: hypothetical protein ACXVRH_04345 [Thermoleophilaceae bacterium]
MRFAGLVTLLLAALAVTAAGCGQSSSTPAQAPSQTSASTGTAPTSAAAGRLTPAAARTIVTRLWLRRETALRSLAAGLLPPAETAAAIAEDRAYVAGVRCGCEPQKDAHTIVTILPEIPRTSPAGTFFAQVRTTNTTSGDHPWYVLAITRAGGGWKIAHVTLGGYKARPPLSGLGVAAGATTAVSAHDAARMVHVAMREAAWANAHAHPTSHTNYGATVRARGVVRPAADGVFGLTLPGGKVLACFTLHELDTYSLRGGLAQDDSRRQWGWQLAPGAYSTVTTDTGEPECAAGTGVGRTVPSLWLEYTPQLVAVTGTPLT